MTRRRFRKQAVSPSLFPFLAVLVCTMGALIVLLVLVVQQARAHASSVQEELDKAESIHDEQAEAQRLELDDYEWQREIFEDQRTELTKDLSERRLELSHLEDHIRRMEEQWQQLRAQAAELQRLDQAEQASGNRSFDELTQLRAAIDTAKQRLEAARNEAATKPQTFAVVPYNGANGTKRRPIYIECTENGITIQPEGVTLRRGDLKGPLGPGNALDAALRATREHWARQGDTAIHGEPYPLLIVRPNGTMAYNYAREALKAWDDEFGYELIDAEMQLAYPNRDPVLSDLLERTIQHARERQAVLIAAMPNQFKRPARASGYVATATRGFQPIDGSGGGLSGAGEGGSTGPAGDGQGDASFRVEGSGSESNSSEANSSEANSSEANGSGANDSSDASRRGADQSSQESSGQGRAGEATSGPGGPMASGSANGAGGQSGASGAGSGSQNRGANWGVPKSTSGGTAYQIPVRVVCKFDRLTILPRPQENQPPVDVMAADPLSRSIDEFVSLLWKQIDQWDSAPVGGYWKPVLEVYVFPGAEGRFMELRSLLSGSGILVQRQAQ